MSDHLFRHLLAKPAEIFRQEGRSLATKAGDPVARGAVLQVESGRAIAALFILYGRIRDLFGGEERSAGSNQKRRDGAQTNSPRLHGTSCSGKVSAARGVGCP